MKGFDCNTKLSYEKALAFKNLGYDFAIRYVGRYQQDSYDIDAQETADILKAELKLAIVQHCPNPEWTPTKDIGVLWGKNAAIFSKQANIQSGTIVYLDLEGLNNTPKQDIIDFCNAWYDEVLTGGYTPGIYVGYNTYLTGDDLYYKLKYQHYWKSLSAVPDVTVRGYEMIQTAGGTVNGIEIDNNNVTGDRQGNQPIFMVPAIKELTWQEIISKVSDSPDNWEKGIDTAKTAAESNGDLGDLEIFKYLPDLIVKIYNAKG